MRKTPLKKQSFINDEFSASIRQARFKITDSNRGSHIRFSENDEKALYRKFVKSNFHSIECRKFSSLEEILDHNNAKCMCGEAKKNHKIDKTPFSLCDPWKENESMEVISTDSFGKIEFFGEDITNTKLTDFVRVSYNDKLDDILELLFNKWNINVGTLCISVIGGTIDFKMRKKEKNIFCQGLIKAAITTNALIITPGLNKGITSVIGDAIQYSQSYLYDKMKHNNFISCLGIAPWGYVKKRNILESAKGRTVHYNVSNEVEQNQPVSLNKHHTHYIFVDDGYRLQMSRKKVAYFRQALENKISQKLGERAAIPVVLLIVEGGHEVLVEGSKRIKENVPLIICVGTGRASNILGEVFQEVSNSSWKLERTRSGDTSVFSENYRKALKTKLIEQNICELHQVDEDIKCIEEIVKKEFLITLFYIKSHQDLDFAILHSLIKRMDFLCDPRCNPLSSQLSLCLIWNRIDIVKDKIFLGDISLSNAEWIAFFKESIMKGRIDFIELFLENVSNLHDFLTTEILDDLYKTYPKSNNFRKTFLILIGRSFSKGLSEAKELVFKMIGVNRKQLKMRNDNSLHPFQELFLWSVLMEKNKCARFFWGKCDDALCLALVATRIYKCLRGTSVRDTDRQVTLTLWKESFENLAVKLIEECHDIDQETAAYLIEKEIPIFEGITCLELANKSKNLKFMSNIVCQNSIDFTWRAGFTISFYECILCILFPCLILMQNKYTKDLKPLKLHRAQECQDYIEVRSMPYYKAKLKRFYMAPQTKFVIHSVTFTSFLLYFSYVVLYGMRRMTLSTHETIFMSYLVILIFESIIEMFQSRSYSIFDRMKYWWKFNYCNKLDAIIILLAISAMALRYPLAYYPIGADIIIIYRCSKTIYSLIVGMLYIRFLRLLTRHKKLGPKMMMMTELVKQLMIYLIIIVIFLASYGVTSQAGYYLQRDFSWSALANLFQYPYYTMLGVIFSKYNVYLSWCDPAMNTTESKDCPEQNVVMPILFAAFVMISNILIMNILVATNCELCENIHKDSIDIWKYNKYSLLLEYEKKPIIPLPFSMIIHIYNILTDRCGESECYNLKNSKLYEDQSSDQTLKIKKRTISEILTSTLCLGGNKKTELDKIVKYYENYSQKSVIKDLSNKKQKSIESRISRMEHRMKHIVKEMDSIHSKLNENVIGDSTFPGKSNRHITDEISKDLDKPKKFQTEPQSLLLKIHENANLLKSNIRKRIENYQTYYPHKKTINFKETTDQGDFMQSFTNEIHCENTDESVNFNEKLVKPFNINEFIKRNSKNVQDIRNLYDKFDQLKLQMTNFTNSIESFVI